MPDWVAVTCARAYLVEAESALGSLGVEWNGVVARCAGGGGFLKPDRAGKGAGWRLAEGWAGAGACCLIRGVRTRPFVVMHIPFDNGRHSKHSASRLLGDI